MSLSYYLARNDKSVAIFELVNQIEALTAELAAYKKDAEWQPIESAPKKSNILLAFKTGDVSVGYWDAFYAVAWVEPVSGELLARHYGDPLLWLPLPAPPDAAIAAQEPK